MPSFRPAFLPLTGIEPVFDGHFCDMPMNLSPFDATLPHDAQLTCRGLDVIRGEVVLCSDVDLTLNAGDICHLTGENGTGKTTLLHQLAGLLPIEQGEVLWQGQPMLPPQPVYIGHQVGIDSQLTVAQNLRFLLALYDVTPTADALTEALAWVGLAGFDDVACYQLSAGQTRRVGLARLWFAHVCPLWLLDEPLTALDGAMIQRLEARMTQYAAHGGTVLVTSHQTLQVANKRLDLTAFMV